MKEKSSKKSATQKFRGRHDIVSPSPRYVKCAKKLRYPHKMTSTLEINAVKNSEKSSDSQRKGLPKDTKKRHSKPAGFPFLIEIRLDIL